VPKDANYPEAPVCALRPMIRGVLCGTTVAVYPAIGPEDGLPAVSTRSANLGEIPYWQVRVQG